MTAFAITGMGLTGVLRLTWVHDNLAHVLEHCEADEPSDTWTGLAGPGYGAGPGRRRGQRGAAAAGRRERDRRPYLGSPRRARRRARPGIPGRYARLPRRRLPARRAALGGPPGHLVTRLVGELRSTGAHAGHGPDPVLAGQAPALGDRLLRAPHQSPRPSPPPRAQYRDHQLDNWGITSRTRPGHRTERHEVPRDGTSPAAVPL